MYAKETEYIPSNRDQDAKRRSAANDYQLTPREEKKQQKTLPEADGSARAARFHRFSIPSDGIHRVTPQPVQGPCQPQPVPPSLRSCLSTL